MTVLEITDHEHCLRAGECWQDREPCPALDPEHYGHERRYRDERPIQVATQCGECLRWWDDAIITSMTPTPAGRCPFEDEHECGSDEYMAIAPLDR